MSEQPDPAAHWLELADGDLAVARWILAGEGLPTYAVAFHAQQAAEKALKGLLERCRIPFQRTHDLHLLFELLPEAARRPFDLGDLDRLTPWAIEGRYGSDEPGFGRADARALLETAERIVKAARDEVARVDRQERRG